MRWDIRIGAEVAVVRDQKLLLGKRKETELWGLPGGCIEDGETYMECAAREAAEETNMNVGDLDYLLAAYTCDHERAFEGTSVVFVAANAEGDAELTEPDEFYEWKWFAKDEIPDDVTFSVNEVKNCLDKLNL